MKRWVNKKVPRLKGYKPLPSVLSKEEVIEFIELMPKETYKVILYTMYSSGLRVGEVVALRVKNIVSKIMQIYIAEGKNEGKNGSARYAIMSERSLKIPDIMSCNIKRSTDISFYRMIICSHLIKPKRAYNRENN